MKKSFYLGEVEITVREILFSITILSIMIGLGVWLMNPILKEATQEATEIVSCVKVSDAEKFGYIKRTNVGKFLSEGVLTAVDSVHINELEGYYFYIRKDKERYTQHTETYTVTDSKGNTHVKTRTYWSWDVIHTDNYVCKRVKYLGQEFLLKDIKYFYGSRYKKTTQESGTIRYVYYTHPTSVNGVMTGEAQNKTYNNLKFKSGETIKNIVESSEKSIKNSPIIFWVFWSFLIIFVIVIFYVLENNWLED